MKHKVWLQEPVESRDSEGGVVRTWSDVAYLWSSIEPLTGGELKVAAAMQSKSTVKIVLRWNRAIGFLDLTTHRLVSHDGVIYNIDSKKDVNTEHKFIECYCKTSSAEKDVPLVNETNHQVLTDESGNPLLGN